MLFLYGSPWWESPLLANPVSNSETKRSRVLPPSTITRDRAIRSVAHYQVCSLVHSSPSSTIATNAFEYGASNLLPRLTLSPGKSGTYGAAASDISPQISGGACRGEIDMSICSGQQPKSSYIPPQCPRSNCGLCYEVTNKGGYGSSHIGGVGNKITVQIIDSCPQTNAWNFCKTEVSKDQRCSDNSTNQLDIDESAYEALTGEAFGVCVLGCCGAQLEL